MNFEVFNLIFLFGELVCYQWLLIHIYLYTGTRLTISNLKTRLLLLLSVFLGMFVPLVTGFVMTFFIWNLLWNVKKLPKKAFREKSKFFTRIAKIKLAQIGYWFWILLIFGLVGYLYGLYIWGVVGRFLSNDLLYPILNTIGIGLIPFVYIAKSNLIKLIQQLQQKKPRIFTQRNAIIIYFMICLIVPILSIWTIYSAIPPSAPADTTQYHAMRVITFNILNQNSEKFDSPNYWENRKWYMATYLALQDPDILCVQEAFVEQLQFLQSNMTNRKYNWTGKGRDDGITAGEFSAILYDTQKYTLLDSETFWLSETPDVLSQFPKDRKRICSWAHFREQTTQSEFFIFCTHYGFSAELQTKSSMLINERIRNLTQTLPVMVMGDFNMMNVYPYYLYLEGFGQKPLYDAFRLTHGLVNPLDGTSAPTFNINMDVGFHIDHIFITPDIYPSSVVVLTDSYDNEHTYSDHYPVRMDCLVPIT